MKQMLAFVISVLTITSCHPTQTVNVPENDNKQFYGTEWSTDDGSEGLKFFSDDRVLFFSQGSSGLYRGEGTFHYSKTTKLINIEGLTVTFPTYMTGITLASLIDNSTLKVYWHYMGDSKNYYELMYRRR